MIRCIVEGLRLVGFMKSDREVKSGMYAVRSAVSGPLPTGGQRLPLRIVTGY